MLLECFGLEVNKATAVGPWRGADRAFGTCLLAAESATGCEVGAGYCQRRISTRSRWKILFSSLEMYDCEIPIESATSFCVLSWPSSSP